MGYKIEPSFSFNERALYEIKLDQYIPCTVEGIRVTLYPGMPKVYWYDIKLTETGEDKYNIDEANLKKWGT